VGLGTALRQDHAARPQRLSGFAVRLGRKTEFRSLETFGQRRKMSLKFIAGRADSTTVVEAVSGCYGSFTIKIQEIEAWRP
jgi:hypothetical protein